MQLLPQLALVALPEDAKAFAEKTIVLPAGDEVTGIRVDFIFSFTPYEQEAIQRGRAIVLHGVPVNFASPEDLVIHKIFSRRPRDLEDVRSILLKNPSLDTSAIEARLAEFDLAVPDQEERYSETFRRILRECNRN